MQPISLFFLLMLLFNPILAHNVVKKTKHPSEYTVNLVMSYDWVPYKQFKPAYGKQILCCVSHFGIYLEIGRIEKIDEEDLLIIHDYHSYSANQILYWMAIPSLPKELSDLD